MAPAPGEVQWSLSQARTWLTRSSSATAAPPFAGAVALDAQGASYREVVALVSRGCAQSQEPAPARPTGVIWEADLDGDGSAERFFTGGCSAERYFVVLKHGPLQWAVWLSGAGLLVHVERRGSAIALISVTEGDGIERSRSLWLQQVDGQNTTRQEFRAVGTQSASPTPAGELCVVERESKLRYEPRVRDAPEDSGMGFEYPGNLLQVLARGSRGYALGQRAGWRWCAFAAPAVPDEIEQIARAMRTPAMLTLSPSPTTFITGWLPERAVHR